MSELALDFLRYIHARHKKLDIDISGSEYLMKIDREVEDIKANKGKLEKLMTFAAKLEDVRFFSLREGREEGVVETTLVSIRNLMETLNLTVGEAMAALKVPQEEHQKYKALLEA